MKALHLFGLTLHLRLLGQTRVGILDAAATATLWIFVSSALGKIWVLQDRSPVTKLASVMQSSQPALNRRPSFRSVGITTRVCDSRQQ